MMLLKQWHISLLTSIRILQKNIKIIGITGTNGKTTTAILLYKLFKKINYKVGLISTIENRTHNERLPATHTTPNSLQLNYLLQKMHAEGCTHCFMEVSSHALVQKRVKNIRFKGAIFTHISHDHLDYHNDFKSYIYAKKILFDDLSKNAFALVNSDDKRSRLMLQNCRAKAYTYSLKSSADFRGKLLENTFEGLLLRIQEQSDVWFRLAGEFNAYNLLAVYATAVILKEDPEQVLTLLSNIPPIKGRFQSIVSSKNIRGIIDYAHTPDAMANILKSLHRLKRPKEQIITVFGCGGNRDKTKRPLMGKIASEESDYTFITTDNPRNELPENIVADIQKGIAHDKQNKCFYIASRKEAIMKAYTLARPHDIVLIIGKGHETYQEINGKKYPFDDRKIIEEYIK